MTQKEFTQKLEELKALNLQIREYLDSAEEEIKSKLLPMVGTCFEFGNAADANNSSLVLQGVDVICSQFGNHIELSFHETQMRSEESGVRSEGDDEESNGEHLLSIRFGNELLPLLKDCESLELIARDGSLTLSATNPDVSFDNLRIF